MNKKGAWHHFFIETHSPSETRALGRRIGQRLTPGMALGLIGPLGSGKTTLVQGMAQGLGVCGVQVASPTFILAREYPGRIPLFHLDLYRLDRPLAELHELGYEEYLDGDGAVVIEWADRAFPLWPKRLMTVELAFIGPSARRITLTARTSQMSEWLRRLGSRQGGKFRRGASSTGKVATRSRSA